MKVYVLIGVFIAGGFFVWWLFWSVGWDIANMPPKNEIVVAFGDSLVEGVGATPQHDLVTLLSQKLGKRIINMGVAGDTTADGLARRSGVIAKNPGTVVVLLGGNDALRRIPLETTKENLNKIVGTLVDSGSVVVLVAVRGNVFSDPYDEMYEDIARSRGAVLVPNVFEGILLRPELTADQIHPNDAGYAIVAERIYEHMKGLYN